MGIGIKASWLAAACALACVHPLWSIGDCAMASVHVELQPPPVVPSNGHTGLSPRLFNDSPQSLTAYVVATREKATRRDNSLIRWDSVVSSPAGPLAGLIPPSGNRFIGGSSDGFGILEHAEDLDVVLLAATFDDGSNCGDPEWVKLTVLNRQSALHVLDSLISDLRAGRDMSRQDLLPLLEASHAKLKTAAAQQRDATERSESQIPAGAVGLFDERNPPAVRKAIVQHLAAMDNVRHVDHFYSLPTGMLRDGAEPGVKRIVDQISKTDIDLRQRIAESKPDPLGR